MQLNSRLLACVLLISLASTVSAQEPQIQASYSEQLSLSELTDKVYQRLPGRLAETKYHQQQQANDVLSQSLFAEPVVANLSHFNDAIGSSDGFQEWEGGLDLPLWLPGQKQQQQSLSAQIAAELPAYQQQLKLQASGEVRTLLWQVKLAEAELEQTRVEWETAQRLQRDVDSRVNAGDLPATERMLASSNTLEAHGKLVKAEAQLQQYLKTYSLITGESVLPSQIVETTAPSADIDNNHPRIVLQDQVIQRLQAEAGLARFDKAVNPNLSLGLRRERGDYAEDFTHSVGVGISIALNADRYSQPAIAKAAAELADAQVARQQIWRELNAQLLVKQEELQSTAAQLDLMTEQDETTQQYYRLQKRAFDLGEINLIDLLRSQSLANQSHSRRRALEVEIEQKQAELNQAMGIIL